MIPTSERSGLEKKNKEKNKAVLNFLTESTFFYRQDKPELYLHLRRNAAAFKEFFEEHFGWRLYIDENVARIIRDRQYNDELRPSNRDLFNLRKRDECLLFALLLEFQDYERNRQGLTADEADSLKFYYGDFLEFSQRRAQEEIGEKNPGPEKLQEAGNVLFQQLVRHRFVRLLERKEAEMGEKADIPAGEHLLYELLPGIRCYNPSLISRRGVIERYSGAETSGTQDISPTPETTE